MLQPTQSAVVTDNTCQIDVYIVKWELTCRDSHICPESLYVTNNIFHEQASTIPTNMIPLIKICTWAL